MPQMQINLLGELSLLRDGAPISLPQSRKTRALLAYLALTGRPHRREPGRDDEQQQRDEACQFEGQPDRRPVVRLQFHELQIVAVGFDHRLRGVGFEIAGQRRHRRAALAFFQHHQILADRAVILRGHDPVRAVDQPAILVDLGIGDETQLGVARNHELQRLTDAFGSHQPALQRAGQTESLHGFGGAIIFLLLSDQIFGSLLS